MAVKKDFEVDQTQASQGQAEPKPRLEVCGNIDNDFGNSI